MRNPDRIDIIINKLRDLWHSLPDWRLGQLISNLQGTGPQDVFFAEDDEWEQRIVSMMNKVKDDYINRTK